MQKDAAIVTIAVVITNQNKGLALNTPCRRPLSHVLISSIIILTAFRATANVVSVDTQNFNPTYNGLDFVTVQSSETLEPGIFNLGLFINYAVNTLPFYKSVGSASPKQTKFGKVRDEIVSTDLSFGLGLTTWWDVGVSIPFMTYQKVRASGAHGEYADRGMTEIRVATKFRFIGDRNGGVGMVLTANANMIENNPFVGNGGGPIYGAEIVGDITLAKRLALALNLG